jgi:hypothetical protein
MASVLLPTGSHASPISPSLIWLPSSCLTKIAYHDALHYASLSSSCYSPTNLNFLTSKIFSAPKNLFPKFPSLWHTKHYSDKLKHAYYSFCCLMYSSLNIESLLHYQQLFYWLYKTMGYGYYFFTVCRDLQTVLKIILIKKLIFPIVFVSFLVYTKLKIQK